MIEDDLSAYATKQHIAGFQEVLDWLLGEVVTPETWEEWSHSVEGIEGVIGSLQAAVDDYYAREGVA